MIIVIIVRLSVALCKGIIVIIVIVVYQDISIYGALRGAVIR